MTKQHMFAALILCGIMSMPVRCTAHTSKYDPSKFPLTGTVIKSDLEAVPLAEAGLGVWHRMAIGAAQGMAQAGNTANASTSCTSTPSGGVDGTVTTDCSTTKILPNSRPTSDTSHVLRAVVLLRSGDLTYSLVGDHMLVPGPFHYREAKHGLELLGYKNHQPYCIMKYRIVSVSKGTAQ